MVHSHLDDFPAVSPTTLPQASALFFDFWLRLQLEWQRAILADYHRFWLEPYLHERAGKRAPESRTP